MKNYSVFELWVGSLKGKTFVLTGTMTSLSRNDAKALIENALGFSLAAQDDFESAINHYRIALKTKSDYPVALNNLAFAKQRLSQYGEASMLYEKVLTIDPNNKTANKQLKQLQKKNNLQNEKKDLGF